MLKAYKSKQHKSQFIKWLVWYYSQTLTLISSNNRLEPIEGLSWSLRMGFFCLHEFTPDKVKRSLPHHKMWTNPVLRSINYQKFSHEGLVSYRIQNNSTNFKWFQEYWMLHQSKINFQFSTHRDFKTMFFTCVDRSGVYNIVGISKFYSRWKNAHTLLLNLTFFKSNLLAFTNKIFVEESMVFNWRLNYTQYKFFKYTQPLLTLSDSSYGNDTRKFFQYLSLNPIDAALITDIKSHEKNVFFLTKTNVYTVGLIPANYRPWRVSFPIPLLADSILGQYYFCHSIIRISSLGEALRFNHLKSRWFSIRTVYRNLFLGY